MEYLYKAKDYMCGLIAYVSGIFDRFIDYMDGKHVEKTIDKEKMNDDDSCANEKFEMPCTSSYEFQH